VLGLHAVHPRHLVGLAAEPLSGAAGSGVMPSDASARPSIVACVVNTVPMLGMRSCR
jgi:hypothetical protein